MTTLAAAAQHIQDEDLMALVDGELTGTELTRVEEHLAACGQCTAGVAALRDTQLTLRTWSVDTVPQGVADDVLAHLKAWNSGEATAARKAPAASRRKWWAWGGAAGALATGVFATLLLVTSGGRSSRPIESLGKQQTLEATVPAGGVMAGAPAPVKAARAAAVDSLQQDQAAPAPAASAAVAGMARSEAMLAQPAAAEPQRTVRPIGGGGRTGRPATAELNAPMIARTVSLSLTVRDVERSRDALEGLLRGYGGYAAEMNVSTPEGGVRTLTASLRVPANNLRGMLAELKGYGKVEDETQSGEEVGQQHADLAARLNTSRQSEERLRGILKTRTGDVADVLQVEEEISRVREEIESMEAEQQGLEHSVNYATVELQMDEEGHNTVATRTVGSRLWEGARHGWNNAAEALVGLVLFVLEYGLAIVCVLALLGLPAWLLWRRWKKVRTRR